MSNYWYFECQDHDPPLRGEDEFTQHTDDEAFRRGLQLAKSRAEWIEMEPRLEAMHMSIQEDYFESNAKRFLRKHPDCTLALAGEYGEYRKVDDE